MSGPLGKFLAEEDTAVMFMVTSNSLRKLLIIAVIGITSRLQTFYNDPDLNWYASAESLYPHKSRSMCTAPCAPGHLSPSHSGYIYEADEHSPKPDDERTTTLSVRVEAGGYENVPGTYSDEQISAWKEIVNAVHSKGSYIFLQLWALGRTADVQTLKELDPSFDLVSASDIPLCAKPEPRPRPLTKDEINDNKRNDEYGGSVENRCRFALEVIDAVVNAVGEEKTGLRIDPIPTFSYLISEIKSRYKDFAYIHAIESAVKGHRSKSDPGSEVNQSNDFVRDIWLPRPMISAGNYDRETALKQAERSKATKEGQLIAFGRHFISNPDFPKRFEKKHSHDTVRQIDLLS
ncbi:hypothetical protein D9758_009598 [Tetrapyrgos nigripes]|uniref:NADH:flavin oxidoreductase/NADH oxidase N-terminal domain-containing protein n=1 Tax=Tetrapyrgos nigripes TaxID=182062 RepID=A0A8H5GCT3_9AGAR|nr:hypothetical protein D9758_009598 [Tetrapyrgos nigripes]